MFGLGLGASTCLLVCGKRKKPEQAWVYVYGISTVARSLDHSTALQGLNCYPVALVTDPADFHMAHTLFGYLSQAVDPELRSLGAGSRLRVASS